MWVCQKKEVCFSPSVLRQQTTISPYLLPGQPQAATLSRPTMLIETSRYTRPAAREVFARVHCLAVGGMVILGQQCAHMGPYQRQAA